VAGGIVLSVVFHRLQPEIGFDWANRVVAFMSLATLAVPIFVMKMRARPPQRRKIFDATPWSSPIYCVSILGAFIAFLGTWTPFFYVGLYGAETGAASQRTAFYLVAVVTAGSVIGRVLPGLIALRAGVFNVVTV
jgi:predicted MFS family arabinose efflux permease